MLASLVPRSPHSPHVHHKSHHEGTDLAVAGKPEEKNRVFRILIARLSSSFAFGADLIFMLNRAGPCFRSGRPRPHELTSLRCRTDSRRLRHATARAKTVVLVVSCCEGHPKSINSEVSEM